MKKKLTAAQLAALAAGATMDAVLASAPEDSPDEDSASQAELFAAKEQVTALTAELATAVSQGAEAIEKLTAVEAELATLKADLEASQAASTAMSGTILARVKNMSVALNAKAPENCDDPVELVRLHAELDTQFQEKFKASRVSASNTAAPAKAKPMWSVAQLDAARLIPVYN
jgi:chromosome segregation ATPase